MNGILKNAYEQYRSHGFVMQKAKHNTKFCSSKGSLSERVNAKWNHNATGYVAVVPPNIIVFDADLYEPDCEFNKLLEALDLDYTPEPTVASPSGGLHYFFENPHPDLVIGAHGFKAVDIKAGYQTDFRPGGEKPYYKMGG